MQVLAAALHENVITWGRGQLGRCVYPGANKGWQQVRAGERDDATTGLLQSTAVDKPAAHVMLLGLQHFGKAVNGSLPCVTINGWPTIARLLGPAGAAACRHVGIHAKWMAHTAVQMQHRRSARSRGPYTYRS